MALSVLPKADSTAKKTLKKGSQQENNRHWNGRSQLTLKRKTSKVASNIIEEITKNICTRVVLFGVVISYVACLP